MKNAPILFVILLFFSCKKHGFGYIEGTVYDCRTSLPIENAKITITKAFHGNQETIYKTTATDAKGNFKIKYENGLSYFYEILISADHYDFTVEKNLDRRKENSNFYLGYKTNVKFSIKNNRTENATVFLNRFNDSFQKITVRAKSDTILTNLFVKGCGNFSYTWNYSTPTYTAAFLDQDINLSGSADTLSQKLELN